MSNISTSDNHRKLRVAMLSPGLGHVRRGFETGAARNFEALKHHGDSTLQVRLFCGGPYPRATRVPSIRRNGRLARVLRRIGILNDGARLEQLAFGLFLMPRLWRMRPDVIWLQEYSLGRLLLRWRTLPFVRSRMNFRIVFCNGAPLGPAQYRHFDFVHHLHRDSFDEGKEAGLSAQRMEISPYCCPTPPSLKKSREELRAEFGFLPDDWVIVCVAAWNRGHKRIDFLIEEVAALKDPKAKLLLCGQPEPETAELKQLAKEKLGEQVQWRTLPPEKVFEAVSLANVFVLSSLSEGLGIVLIEAALAGVPVVCHPHSGAHAVFDGGEERAMVDLSQPGSLTARLHELRRNPPTADQLEHMRQTAWNRFSSEAVGPKFAALLRRAHEAKEGEAPN